MRKVADYSALQELVRHHIDSFDHFIDSGLDAIISHIKPVRITDASTGTKLQIWFDKAELLAPQKEERVGRMRQSVYPAECRRAGLTYHGKLVIRTCFQYNSDANAVVHKFNFGYLPIMLKSKLCHLRDADSKKLVSFKEEQTEMGGYFICNGLERLVRVLIMPKRNHPTAVVRNAYSNRGEGYTNKAVVMRCVRDDQSSVTVRLYYLKNGSARLGFAIKAREYLLPVGVVLKALVDSSDREIFVNLTSGFSKMRNLEQKSINRQLVGERATIILNEVRSLGLVTRQQCLNHIGEYFQPVMEGFEAEDHSLVGDAVLKDFLFVQLSSNYDKFNLLIFMLQKLFALVDETTLPDNEDALQNQEVLLPGHLIAIYLKEKLQEWLYNARHQLLSELQSGKKFNFHKLEEVRKLMEKNTPINVGKAIENMIKTGRLITSSGLDLQQRAGMSIVAERLNFLRFLSHFQSVHRGASFTTMRTTTVRKLLPESWGFLCPVHTPDGEPCGLLNHMTSSCRITSYYDSNGNIKNFFNMRKLIVDILVGMGMTPSLPKLDHAGLPEALFVLLDGRIIGSLMSTQIEKVVSHIRRLKVSATSVIPADLEVGFVPFTEGGAYPGLYLFTSPSRFIRPVRNMSCSEGNSDIELIGPFEQAFMEIKCEDGGDGGRTDAFPATHEEIHPTGLLSVVANLTPFSDHNQSPRNMYQCQMAKQTMGFSSQAIQHRLDNKLYHLQTPQSPIVRTSSYEKYAIDEFPTGTNAIVAVLAYTGYDMEDAMILNKSSVERGMCHGHIYQVESIDLTEKRGKEGDHEIFRRSAFEDKSASSPIDADGLPFVGQRIQPDGPYCSIYNTDKSFVKTHRLKGSEPATIDYVSVDGKSSKQGLQKVDIRFRRLRNPVIGDKFSSRHGQKGVCSQLWPDVDMPFSGATGMRPDLIINPHAFPSRMTIGMLLESIAAKGGSLHGKFVDATPFPSSCKQRETSDGSKSLVDELGPLLASHGFNYHGVEVLYSGVLGTELTCEIFIGPVYYQRLRHMVSDKYQVRSTGTMDRITRQPVKGRKVGGGIRFGEMERDSVLAHGAAYLLHDRLHTCSDYHIADVCTLCGSILTASVVPSQQKRATIMEDMGLPRGKGPKKKVFCNACKTSKGMETVAMPYVFRYLTTELAAMNIKLTLQLSNRGAQTATKARCQNY